MNIIRATGHDVDLLAPLAAAFRVALKSYKGIAAKPDCAAGAQEIAEYLQAGFPVYRAMDGEVCAGYLVCRVEEPTVWVESLYVAEPYRRRGVAGALLRQAEQLAHARGQDTVFQYVHPNNDNMIAFLRKHGYTVLNLIELRKPFSGEILSDKIRIGNNTFDY